MPSNTPDAPIARGPAAQAKRLGIGRSTLYRLMSQGKLPARKIGSRTLILDADADALLAGAPAFRHRSASSAA